MTAHEVARPLSYLYLVFSNSNDAMQLTLINSVSWSNVSLFDLQGASGPPVSCADFTTRLKKIVQLVESALVDVMSQLLAEP